MHKRTTQALAESIQKAGGAANTFGVEMEQLIGHATAIGQVTRESGNILGNSLKTIYSRITTMSGSMEKLEQAGISVYDSMGQLRNVGDILDDLGDKWSNLNSETQQQLGLQLAGRFQLSRFLTLMQQYEQAQLSTASAINSHNSAINENQRFLESHQAKINQMKNSITSAYIAVGESFANDTLVAFVEATTNAVKAVTSLIERFGALPVIMSATAPMFLLMNRGLSEYVKTGLRANTMVENLAKSSRKVNASLSSNSNSTKHFTYSLNTNSATLSTNTTATNVNTTAKRSANIQNVGLISSTRALSLAKNTLTVATRGLGIALRGLLASTGIGLALVGIGVAIEKTISYFNKSKVEAKKYQDQIQQITTSFKENQSTIEENVKSLKKLEEIKKSSGLTNDQEKEYIALQNELAELLPSIVKGTDDKGNAILITSQYIEKEIELLKEKLELEKKIAKNNAVQNIGQTKADLIRVEREIQEFTALRDTSRLEFQNAKSDSAKENHYKNIIKWEGQLAEKGVERLGIISQLNSQYKDIVNNLENLNDKDLEHLSTFSVDSATSIGALQQLAVKINETRSLIGDMFSAEEIIALPESKINTLKEINAEIKQGGTNWEEYKTQLSSVGFEGSAKAVDTLKEKHEKLNKAVSEGILFSDAEGKNPISPDMLESLEEYGELWIKTENGMQKYGEEVDNLTGALDSNTDSLWDNISATEVLFGKTSQQIQQIRNAIEVYTLLTNAENLNAQQTEQLRQAKEFLASVFPHLVKGTEYNISAMRKEADIIEGMGKLSADYANGRLSTEDAMTFATVSGVNQRIQAYEKELHALNEAKKSAVSMLKEIGKVAEATGYYDYDKEHGALVQWQNASAGIPKLERAIYESSAEMRKIWDGSKLPELSGMSPKSSSGSSKSSPSSSSSKADDPTKKDTLDALIRQINLQHELTALDAEKLRKQIEIAKSQNDYNKQLELTNQLIKNQDKNLKEIQQANQKIHEQANAIRKTNSQFDTSNWFDNNNQETVQYLNQFNKASKEQQEKMSEVFTALQKLKNAYGNNVKEINNLRDATKNLTKDNEQLVKQIKEDLSKDVIDTYKESYRKQNQIVQEGIKQQMKTLEDAHKRKMQMYDDELKKFEDTINAQLRALDDEATQEDYNAQITDLQSEQFKLEQQINAQKLDDSRESKVIQAQLEEELAKVIKQIEDLRLKRTRDLRKQNLQDALEEKRKEIQIEKDAAQEIYDINRERLDKEAEYWNRHFENIIEDERRWMEVRRQIMNENVNGIVSEFERLENEIKPAMELIGESITKNLIDKITEAKRQLNSLGSGNFNGASSNSNEASIIAQMKANSQAWHNASPTDKKLLEAENQKLGASIGAAYDSKFGKWIRDGLPLYHKGGIVGDKPSKISELVNKLFNVKPNEEVAKLLKGEVVINPQNALANFIPNLQNTMSMISPNVSTAEGVNNHYHLEMKIGQITGDKKGGETVFNTVATGLKKLGLKN